MYFTADGMQLTRCLETNTGAEGATTRWSPVSTDSISLDMDDYLIIRNNHGYKRRTDNLSLAPEMQLYILCTCMLCTFQT